MDDLKERMREWWEYDPGHLIPQAAARIEALEARLHHYKHEVVETALANENDAADEITRLRAKLEECLECNEEFSALEKVHKKQKAALEARIAKADALASAQQFFNFCAVEILTYGATVARLQNLENAWVNLKTQDLLVQSTQ